MWVAMHSSRARVGSLCIKYNKESYDQHTLALGKMYSVSCLDPSMSSRFCIQFNDMYVDGLKNKLQLITSHMHMQSVNIKYLQSVDISNHMYLQSVSYNYLHSVDASQHNIMFFRLSTNVLAMDQHNILKLVDTNTCSQHYYFYYIYLASICTCST